jgi:transketolase
MVSVLLEALPELARDRIHPTVVNVSSLPVNIDMVEQLVVGNRHVFVVEDHFVTGGISDEIGRIILRMDATVHFGSKGVEDYGQAGSPEELYSRYQLDPPGIVALIRSFVGAHSSQPDPAVGQANLARQLAGPTWPAARGEQNP